MELQLDIRIYPRYNNIMKYYRVFSKEFKSLDSSLYLEERTSKNGNSYYVQVEDYTISAKGKIYTTKIRKSVFENAIKNGLWIPLNSEYRLV